MILLAKKAWLDDPNAKKIATERCLRQSTTLVKAEHEMSDEIRKRDRITKGQQAVLAGAMVDRPTLVEAVRPTIDGDFNPSEIFRSLLSYYGTFELARALGRYGRGHHLCLDVQLAREMKRQIELRDALDNWLMKHPENIRSDEEATAFLITQTAYELHPKTDWVGRVIDVIATGRAIDLAG